MILNLAARFNPFLPKENSIENIATLYLPLDKVGGDFLILYILEIKINLEFLLVM